MFILRSCLMVLLLCAIAWGEGEEFFPKEEPNISGPALDFEQSDQFIDIPEAVSSRNFVRRTVLTNAVKHSARFQFERIYLQHLMGFNAIYQRTRFAKFVSGVQGIGAGYVFSTGDALEAGIELSAISAVYAGYKHVFAFESVSIWPFVGLGGGRELSALAIADGPPEAEGYAGRREMGFFNIGLMLPLVDVGLRAEVRANFYGLDRLILTSGIGAVVFL